MVQAEGSSPGIYIYKYIYILLGLMDFSGMVILCSRTNSFANKALNVLICLYYP